VDNPHLPLAVTAFGCKLQIAVGGLMGAAMPCTTRVCAIVSFAMAVAGCAIHPLPEDYAGLDTTGIVRKIRCEARDGIRDKLAQWLYYRRDFPNALALAEGLQSRKLSLNEFTKASTTLDPRTLFYINLFAQTAISYNFKLDMTETNTLGATIDLLKPFKNATGTAVLGAGFDRTRQNIRSFTITDNYHKLVDVMRDDYCTGQIHARNYVYPITGNIGINEMIDTFVDLSLFGGLGPKPSSADAGGGTKMASLVTAEVALKSAPKKSAAPAPVVVAMGDSITFTTKLSGSAAPKVVFTPIGRGLSVADASLTAAASRTDVHQVIVGMAVPAPPVLPSVRSLTSTTLIQLAHPVGTTPEERSLEVIGEHIYRFEPRPLSTGVIIAP
jgi:hypothetical protein